MADISCEYAGLRLRSPVIAAPAGVTGTAELACMAEDNGCGAFVMKSLFAESVSRRAPTPHFKVIKHNLGNFRSSTLYSYEQASPFAPERYAEEIIRCKGRTDMPIIASINCRTDEQWVEYAKLCERAKADALEINTSCPHGLHIMGGLGIASEMLEKTQLVKSHVKIPVIPKMTPQLDNPLAVALALEEAGADAVVMFNRFTGLEIDIETEAPVMHGGYAGHGGPWSLLYVARWVTAVSPKLNIPIAASGGVAQWEDVVKLLLCGAGVVQTCTAIVLSGYRVVKGLNEGLANWMNRKGYETLSQFRGKSANKILTTNKVDREQRLQARIRQENCTACDKCRIVCIHRGVDVTDKFYAINASCQGCGLCAEVCPPGAIDMVPREEAC